MDAPDHVLAAVCPYYALNTADMRPLSRQILAALLRLRSERFYLVQNSLQFIYAFGVFVLLVKARQQAGLQVSMLQSVALVANKVAEGGAIELPR